MAINRGSISTADIRDNYEVVIEMLATAPVPGATFATERPVGQLVGWYNSGTDSVQLYIVDRTGFSFVRAG